jgi:hypothetical protein
MRNISDGPLPERAMTRPNETLSAKKALPICNTLSKSPPGLPRTSMISPGASANRASARRNCFATVSLNRSNLM